MKVWLLVVIFVGTAMRSHCQGQEAGQLKVPSLNFWRMSSALLIERVIREKLQVTPMQLKLINQMRGSEKFARLFADGSRDLRFSSSEVLQQEDLLYMHFDSDVRNGLAEILTKAQLNDLMRAYLRFRFPKGISPFGDPEIHAALKLSGEDAKSFLKFVDKIKAEYEQTVSQLRSATATAVVSELPIEASLFLSQLLGNKYVPNVPLFPEEKFNSIPFTQHFFYYAIGDIVHGPAVASKFGISEKQVAEISEINRSLNEIKEDKKNRFPNPDRRFFHASDYSRNEALKILTNEQAVLLAREEMLIRFEISPSTVLSRLEVQKYLGLEEKEAKYLVSVALKAEEERALSVGNLDRSVFEGICDSLPAVTATKIRVLFREVW